VYTQLLNRRGGIESDLTVTRLAADRFRLVIGTAFGNHDLAWIRKQLAADERVEVRDVTGAHACYGLWGPRARDVLSTLTDADLSNDAFPYLSARAIDVAAAPCLALRVTYVGELGWELYAPAEHGASLFDELLRATREAGGVPAGYRAIDSLRVEKGYLAWGSDLTPEEDPFQAGLGFAVDLSKDFLGREALETRRGGPALPRLACLVLDDPRAMVLGNEPVSTDGEVVARVTSGGIGFAVERSIAFAYLPEELAHPGTRLETEVFGERVGAEVARRPIWDPAGERIRA
jgi:4-methylaminobutanoate oxidase (formaldehyde-forming)